MSFIDERIEGLNSLLISSHDATRYKIQFEVTINKEKGRKRISRDIYRMLTYRLSEKFGGWVARLPDAVCKYQIVLFLCSACRTGIANDGTFTPLWKFVQNILKVPLTSVHIAPTSSEHSDWFERFEVVRGPEEPPGWSEDESGDEEVEDTENMDFFLA